MHHFELIINIIDPKGVINDIIKNTITKLCFWHSTTPKAGSKELASFFVLSLQQDLDLIVKDKGKTQLTQLILTES